MIEVKLDSKAKNTVAKTLDLGGGDDSQGLDKACWFYDSV